MSEKEKNKEPKKTRQVRQTKKTEETEETKKTKKDDLGTQMEKFAARTAESIRKVIDKALSSRNTVLTIRVNDECNEKLNMLVDAGLFKSRSESAAFLIQEGIKVQEPLFQRISSRLEKIVKIRSELKSIVEKEIEKKPRT